MSREVAVHAAGKAIGGAVGAVMIALGYSYAAMVALSNIHDDLPIVPALGYWACVGSVLLCLTTSLVWHGVGFKEAAS